MSLSRSYDDAPASRPQPLALAAPRPTRQLPIPTHLHPKPVLVVDLDETLIHHSKLDPTGDQHPGPDRFQVPTKQGTLLVLVRPWAREFVASVARGFTVIVFTAGSEEYAQGIVKYLDPYGDKIYTHLSYEACTQVAWFGRPTDGSQTKDLTKVVTDLSRVLLVDNTVGCFDEQPDNGILIRGWNGEAEDSELPRLEHLLLHHVNARDMRDVAERWTNWAPE